MKEVENIPLPSQSKPKIPGLKIAGLGLSTLVKDEDEGKTKQTLSEQ